MNKPLTAKQRMKVAQHCMPLPSRYSRWNVVQGFLVRERREYDENRMVYTDKWCIETIEPSWFPNTDKHYRILVAKVAALLEAHNSFCDAPDVEPFLEMLKTNNTDGIERLCYELITKRRKK